MGLVAAAATAIGIATATAFEAIAAVGVALSVIGAVTHDKALSYVGAGLGLVGGIGAVASSAGLIGADAVSDATAVDQGAWDTGTAEVGSTADAGSAATSGDVVSSLSDGNAAVDQGTWDTGATAAAGEPAAASGSTAPMFSETPGSGPVNEFPATDQAGSATAGGPNTAGPPTTAQPAANTSLPPPVAASVNGPGYAQSGANTNAVLNASGGASGGFIGSGGGTLAPESSGIFDTLAGFAKEYPLLAYGAVQGAASLISGFTSTLTPAQVTALNAQAANNQAAANLTTQQTQNLAQPRSTANLAPVTGTPNNIITPPNAGIINGAPPVNVTGATA